MVNKGSVRIGNLPGIRRLPFYLNILRRLQGDGKTIISAVSLAEETGHPTPVVKKDIEMTGAAGKTGVGYDIDSLIADIEAFLGWNQIHDAILVGVGNLGSALLGYGGFKSHGLQFIAAFDADVSKVGKSTHGVEVLPLSKIKTLAARRNVRTAVVTVPADNAQQVADLLVAAGITRIWNFAPVMLTVPETVMVQREDLSAGLAELLVRGRANEGVGES